MKELRRSSPIILHLLLQVVKQNSLFFFYLRILSRIFTIHRTVGDWGGTYLSISLLPLSLASQTLRNCNWVIVAESSPLRIAGGRT